MMTVNISNPLLESCLKSLAFSHSKDADDIVQGALATQFGYMELAQAFTSGPSMSELECEQLSGCQG